MNKSVSTATRQFVALRADYRCEYCRKPELVANFAFHVEHIIGRQYLRSFQTCPGQAQRSLLYISNYHKVTKTKRLH